MSNSFQFIDIIFFAMIAIFLILRLRGVLGKRDGNNETGFLDLFKQDLNKIRTKEKDEDDNIVRMPEIKKDADLESQKRSESQDKNDVLEASNEAQGPLASGITHIKNCDSNFDEEDFLAGANVAFEIILGAYASADTSELKPLLSGEVYSNFSKAIKDRSRAGHIMEDTLVGITKSEMVEAYMLEHTAHITIKFISEQVNAVRDERGDVVEGDASVVLTVNDFWTFARDTKNDDPNWLLVATRSLE